MSAVPLAVARKAATAVRWSRELLEERGVSAAHVLGLVASCASWEGSELTIHRTASPAWLSAESGLCRSEVHLVLRTLERAAWVSRVGRGRYVLTDSGADLYRARAPEGGRGYVVVQTALISDTQLGATPVQRLRQAAALVAAQDSLWWVEYPPREKGKPRALPAESTRSLAHLAKRAGMSVRSFATRAARAVDLGHLRRERSSRRKAYRWRVTLANLVGLASAAREKYEAAKRAARRTLSAELDVATPAEFAAALSSEESARQAEAVIARLGGFVAS